MKTCRTIQKGSLVRRTIYKRKRPSPPPEKAVEWAYASCLVMMIIEDYDEEGHTIIKETTQAYDGSASQTATWKLEQDWVLDPPDAAGKQNCWLKYTYHYHWDKNIDPPNGSWVHESTVEQDKDKNIVNVTYY
jgi:hypothetical protein